MACKYAPPLLLAAPTPALAAGACPIGMPQPDVAGWITIRNTK